MSILQPRIILALGGVAAVLILASLAQEVNRRLAVQREVRRLEQEVEEMNKSVIELENLNRYFQTDDFKDRMAREKLNYSAPGEKVVVIPDEAYAAAEKAVVAKDGQNYSIPERWWRLFFVDQSVWLKS